MFSGVGIGLVIGMVVAVGVAGGRSNGEGRREATAQSVTGIWDSHLVQESYRISLGVDALKKPRKPETVDEIRVHYNLPQHYGNLIGVTGNGEAAVLWYQDNQGIVRNAIVPKAASKLARIGYSPTQRYEEEVLP